MNSVNRNSVSRPEEAEYHRRRRGWPEWTWTAALIWTLIYGALSLYWTLGGEGFPFGLENDPHAVNSIIGHASAASAAPVIAILCLLGVVALLLCKLQARGFTRTLLILFSWSAAAVLSFAIMDERALIAAAYTPICLAGALFGWPLDRYFDFVAWPVANQFICAAGGLCGE